MCIHVNNHTRILQGTQTNTRTQCKTVITDILVPLQLHCLDADLLNVMLYYLLKVLIGRCIAGIQFQFYSQPCKECTSCRVSHFSI